MSVLGSKTSFYGRAAGVLNHRASSQAPRFVSSLGVLDVSALPEMNTWKIPSPSVVYIFTVPFDVQSFSYFSYSNGI